MSAHDTQAVNTAPIHPCMPVVVQQGFLRRAIRILGVLGMLVLGLITLMMIGAETGMTALYKGMILAVIPVPIYVLLLLWIDRFEREPGRLLALCFLWGATVAAFISYAINTYVTVHAGSLFGLENGLMVTAVIASPLTEEIAKGLALLVLCLWQRDEFDGVMDGIVYAGMVGLGFAMFENVLYYGKAATSGKLADVLILRGFLSPFSHPLFTSMTGIGLGLGLTTRRAGLRFVFPVVGFLLAVTIHFLWNLSAANGSLPQTYDHLMVPIFVSILLIIGLEPIISSMLTKIGTMR